MKPLLRIPDESGEDILIGVAQITSVRYANIKRRGEIATIRLSDGQMFEVRADLFDAELEALVPAPVAAVQPVTENHQEPEKPALVVKRKVSKSR